MPQYDVIILGGGPAGLSAALNVRARNKTALVVSNPLEENPLWSAHLVDNHLGMPMQSGADMLSAMQEHAKAKGVDFMPGKALTAMPMQDSIMLSVGSDVVEGTALVLATGVARNKKFEGEDAYLGRGVSYCATCDAFAYRGKTVAVLGYAPSAQHEAEFLEQVGCTVHYFDKPKTCTFAGDGALQSITCDGQTVEVAGVFILRPAMAPTDLFPAITLAGGYIAVNRNMETNLPGVYAAGDCTGTPLQVSKAVGEGLIAGQKAAAYAAQKSRG
ncbi:MAG: NAD(P)/FAD-dependent oxidoreductase [Faecalibacterium sp.]